MANRWEMMVEFRAEWWLFKSMHVNFSPFLKRHGSTVKSLFIEEMKENERGDYSSCNPKIDDNF